VAFSREHLFDLNSWLGSGREEKMVDKVAKKHTVTKNPTVPPFPENMQMAMFGEYERESVVSVHMCVCVCMCVCMCVHVIVCMYVSVRICQVSLSS
jgi:hypothetical protein